jgi:hypothetical protein
MFTMSYDYWSLKEKLAVFDSLSDYDTAWKTSEEIFPIARVACQSLSRAKTKYILEWMLHKDYQSSTSNVIIASNSESTSRLGIRQYFSVSSA